MISRTNAKLLYYSLPQQLIHHAMGGCAMSTGDLLGSGTISGPTRDASGSRLDHMEWRGADGARRGGARTFVKDGGDTLTLRVGARVTAFASGLASALARFCPHRPSWNGLTRQKVMET